MAERELKPKVVQPISVEDRDLLRLVLRKDNDGINEEIRNAETDVVFRLAFEGGGLEVTRYRTAKGKFYFRTSGTSMTLDTNDIEEWIEWEDDAVASFEGSLGELRLGKDLRCITPIFVHPDYYSSVRKYIETLLAEVTPNDRRRMGEFLAVNVDAWFHPGERLRRDKQ